MSPLIPLPGEIRQGLFVRLYSGGDTIYNYVIRKAKETDARAIADIIEEAFLPDDDSRMLGKLGAAALFSLLPSLSRSILLVCESIDGNNRILGFIWIQSGPHRLADLVLRSLKGTIRFAIEIIGAGKTLAVARYMTRAQTVESYPRIAKFAVSSSVRRTGVGGMLLSEAIDNIRRSNVHELYVRVSAENIEGKSFYRKMGFNILTDNGISIVLKKSFS